MAGEKKQALRDECDERGISYTQRDTIKDLEAKLGRRSSSSKAPPARDRVRTSTCAGSARSTVSRSGGGTGGSSRARSAALAKSAPTVRMRVDSYDQQTTRQPGAADILAVALVVLMGVLAAMNTPTKGKGGPTGHTPAHVIVAQA